MSLLLALPRRLYEGSKVVAEGKWNGWSPTKMLGKRINGIRLGIIGMGRIGQAVAKRAKPLEFLFTTIIENNYQLI